jgi:glutamate--cysteine ligase
MRLLDLFLLHCLLSASPPDSPQELVRLAQNQHRTAARGREPGLTLQGEVGAHPLQAWAEQLLEDFVPIAERVAAVLDDERYLAALEQARAALRAPQTLPSARVLAALHEEHGDSYVGFVQARSQATRVHLLTLPYAPAVQARFEKLAAQSLAAQAAIEAADDLPFETFRQQYLAPERLEA